MLPAIRLTDDEFEIIKQHFHKSACQTIRLRCHAIILTHKGYTLPQIADILLKSEQTVYRWFVAFSNKRIGSLFPQYLGNQHAAKLTRKQKAQLGKVLCQPPSKYQIPKEFWDISSLKTYIKAEFGVEYESSESYRLIFLLHNYSFHLPDAFDRHRDEEKIKTRISEIKAEIRPYIKDQGWTVFVSDECRIVWETEIRRLWLPKGQKSVIRVERKREAQSFIGFLNLQTGEELLFPLSWQRQDTIIPVLEGLTLRYPNRRICIIWDNAKFHKGKKIRKKLSTTLRRVHLINLPPYAPDHNPQEHVWKYGKEKLANTQRESLEETVQAFESIVTGRTYRYKF